MSFKKVLCLLSLTGAFLLPAPVQAQVGRRDTGLYIRGYVRAEPNRYAEGVKVDLKRETGQVLNSDYTRFNGQFEFFGLSVGIYVLEVEVEGFQPVRQVVEINAPPGRHGVTLMLRPLAGRSTTPTGAISAREMAIPEKARSRFQEAERQLREKNTDRAVADLKDAVKLYPEYYEAHQLLGVAYLQLEKQKEAEAAFRKSIEVSEETYGPAYAGLASLFCDQKNFTAAEPLARHATELDENAWQGHFELARALLGLDRAAEAESSAAHAVKSNADLTRGYLLLAKIHQALENYPSMLTDLDEFLRREPKGPTSDQIRKTRAQLAKALTDSGVQVPPEPPPF